MATRKSAKKSGTKKLTKAKKMDEVKPLITSHSIGGGNQG